MKDPAIAIKDYLVAQSHGVFGASSGWSINIGRLPDTPDTVILLTSTGGRTPYPHLLVNEPSLQVMVRGAKNAYPATRTKLEGIVRSLLGFTTQVLQGDTYRSCNQIGDISYLGQDDNTRPLFSANFWFVVLPAAEAGGHRVAIT